MSTTKSVAALALVALLFAVAAAQQKQPPVNPNGGGAPSKPAPMMVIESDTHDFGEINAGTPLRYAFRIKNQGTADLLINSVSPG